jgi:hypothetical protein
MSMTTMPPVPLPEGKPLAGLIFRFIWLEKVEARLSR